MEEERGPLLQRQGEGVGERALGVTGDRHDLGVQGLQDVEQPGGGRVLDRDPVPGHDQRLAEELDALVAAAAAVHASASNGQVSRTASSSPSVMAVRE